MNGATIAVAGVMMTRLIGMGCESLQAQPTSGPSEELLQLAQAGTAEQVQAALNHGAEVNTKDGSGRTALYFAADRATSDDKTKILKILLAQPHIEVNAAADWGETALYNASQGCDTVAVDMLLYAGADPYMRINATFYDKGYVGWSPYDAALSRYANDQTQTNCLALLSRLSPPLGSLHAAYGRLKLAVCPETLNDKSYVADYKCYCRLAHFKDASRPDGDGEIWLTGRISPDAACPDCPVQPQSAHLCDDPGPQNVCNGGFSGNGGFLGYRDEADITFVLDLDDPSQTKVQNILQHNPPIYPPIYPDGCWNAAPPTVPAPLKPGGPPSVTRVHCEAVAFARSQPYNQPEGAITLFRGWREEGDWSLEFDGAGFWQAKGTTTAKDQADINFRRLKLCPQVRVRGVLVMDNEPGNMPELHPISRIEFIQELNDCSIP